VGIVVLLVSEGQHPAEEISVLPAPLKEGRAALVSGSPMLATLRPSRIHVFGTGS